MIRLLILFISLFLIHELNAQKFTYQPYNKTYNESVDGEKGIKALFFKEFVYPQEALKKQYEGSVTFQYTLTPEGKTTNFRTLSATHPMLEKEATRMFKKIQWKAVKYRPVHMTDGDRFTVHFSLKDWAKISKKRGYQTIEYNHPVDESGKTHDIKELDQRPEPIYTKGSYNNFNQYMMAKMQFPETALRLNLKGQVILGFVIEPSGNVTNIEVRKPLNGGCTEEAVRLVKSLKWKAGIQNGILVRTQMATAIGFGVASQEYYDVMNHGQQTK